MLVTANDIMTVLNLSVIQCPRPILDLLDYLKEAGNLGSNVLLKKIRFL